MPIASVATAARPSRTGHPPALRGRPDAAASTPVVVAAGARDASASASSNGTGGLEPPRRLGLEGALDDVDERVAQVGPASRSRGGGLRVRRRQLVERRAATGNARSPGEEQHAEAVDVGGCGGRPAAQQLRREIQRRAGPVAPRRRRLHPRPAPKSIRTRRPPSSRITFCALTSRCTRPAPCTAASARHSSLPISAASRRRKARARRPRPSVRPRRTPSTGRRGRSCTSAPCTVTTLGCRTREQRGLRGAPARPVAPSGAAQELQGDVAIEADREPGRRPRRCPRPSPRPGAADPIAEPGKWWPTPDRRPDAARPSMGRPARRRPLAIDAEAPADGARLVLAGWRARRRVPVDRLRQSNRGERQQTLLLSRGTAAVVRIRAGHGTSP